VRRLRRGASMSEYFEAGDVVYLTGGRKAKYVASVEDAHLIRLMYEDDGAGEPHEWLGDPVVVSVIHRHPPRAQCDAEIACLSQTISEKAQELSELQAQMREHRRLLDKLSKQVPVLQHIEDVIEDRITHFVMIDYSVATIKTKTDALKIGDDSWSGDLRLLSLHGKSKGELAWRINRYADGSGNYHTAIPCISEDEARTWVQEWALKMIAGGKTYDIGQAVESLKLAGLPVPPAAELTVELELLKRMSSAHKRASIAWEKEQASMAAQFAIVAQLRARGSSDE